MKKILKVSLKIKRMLKKFFAQLNNEFEKDRITDYIEDFKFFKHNRYW